MLPSTTRFSGRAQVLLGALLLGHAPLLAQASNGGTRDETLTMARAVTIARVDRAPRLEDFRVPNNTLTVLNGPLTFFDDSLAVLDNSTTPGAPVAVTEFRQRKPGDGVPVSQPTTAYLSYDDANLYVVFVCRDDPAKVRANIARRESVRRRPGVMY
jgi:hypothetical protein